MKTATQPPRVPKGASKQVMFWQEIVLLEELKK
jgi:hypothetical protein